MSKIKTYTAEYEKYVTRVNALFSYQAQVKARDKLEIEQGIKARATDIKVKVSTTIGGVDFTDSINQLFEL